MIESTYRFWIKYECFLLKEYFVFYNYFYTIRQRESQYTNSKLLWEKNEKDYVSCPLRRMAFCFVSGAILIYFYMESGEKV